jgi:glutamyl-tRNA reductase
VSVVVVGIEQGKAPLDLLEQVSVTDDALPKALATLRDRSNLSEAVIVSTCLRTEIYAVVERFHDGVAEIQDFLASIGDTTVASLTDHLVIRFDDDVADHLFTVAAGLDSAVIGESEVLGQVRRAWEKAQRDRASGPVLGALFRHAVETGKRVRSETAIARGITSLSYGAVALAADRRSGTLSGARVLVVGSGEMGEGVARAIDSHDVASLVVANRSAGRALEVVAGLPDELRAHSRTTGLSGLEDEIVAADVVFTTVGAPHPIIEHPMVESAVARRAPAPPLLIIDLGVPRNVEPSVAAVADVTLLDIESLRAAVADALSGRQGEMAQARTIVGDEVERYRTASRARGAAPVISALRSQAEQARLAELERQRSKRSDLTDQQWDQVDAVTRSMVAKLMHRPTVALKDAAGTPRGERLVEALRTLFDL